MFKQAGNTESPAGCDPRAHPCPLPRHIRDVGRRLHAQRALVFTVQYGHRAHKSATRSFHTRSSAPPPRGAATYAMPALLAHVEVHVAVILRMRQ